MTSGLRTPPVSGMFGVPVVLSSCALQRLQTLFRAAEQTRSETETERESKHSDSGAHGRPNAGAARTQCPHVGCRPASLRVLRPIGLAMLGEKKNAEPRASALLWPSGEESPLGLPAMPADGTQCIDVSVWQRRPASLKTCMWPQDSGPRYIPNGLKSSAAIACTTHERGCDRCHGAMDFDDILGTSSLVDENQYSSDGLTFRLPRQLAQRNQESAL